MKDKNMRYKKIAYCASGTKGCGYKEGRVALPKPWLEALGLNIDNREIKLEFDGEKIVITPANSESNQKKVEQAPRKTNLDDAIVAIENMLSSTNFSVEVTEDRAIVIAHKKNGVRVLHITDIDNVDTASLISSVSMIVNADNKLSKVCRMISYMRELNNPSFEFGIIAGNGYIRQNQVTEKLWTLIRRSPKVHFYHYDSIDTMYSALFALFELALKEYFDERVNTIETPNQSNITIMACVLHDFINEVGLGSSLIVTEEPSDVRISNFNNSLELTKDKINNFYKEVAEFLIKVI